MLAHNLERNKGTHAAALFRPGRQSPLPCGDVLVSTPNPEEHRANLRGGGYACTSAPYQMHRILEPLDDSAEARCSKNKGINESAKNAKPQVSNLEHSCARGGVAEPITQRVPPCRPAKLG